MVLHSLTFSPEHLAGVAAGWENGSEIGLVPAQRDGSVGAGARAELSDVVRQGLALERVLQPGLCSQLCSGSWADAEFFPRTWRRAWRSPKAAGPTL